MKKLIIAACFLFTICLNLSSCTEKENPQPEAQKVSVKPNPGAIALLDECDEGEDEDPLPMLTGTVRDSLGNPISHACVELRTSTHQFVAIIGTNSSGHYYFNSVSNGSYYLIVGKTGYTSEFVNFSIVSQTPQNLNVTLE